MKKAIVYLFERVEEMEAIAPIDILQRGGVEVTTVSINQKRNVRGRSGLEITANALIGEVDSSTFDALILPGGPGTYDNIQNTQLLNALKAHNKSGKLVGAICAAPIILKEAGLLSGRAYTAYPGTLKEVDAQEEVADVVESQNIITSRGAGTATQFALALLKALKGELTAKEVAKSICFGEY